MNFAQLLISAIVTVIMSGGNKVLNNIHADKVANDQNKYSAAMELCFPDDKNRQPDCRALNFYLGVPSDLSKQPKPVNLP